MSKTVRILVVDRSRFSRDTLMTKADKALSKAKSEGRGRVFIHSREGLEPVS